MHNMKHIILKKHHIICFGRLNFYCYDYDCVVCVLFLLCYAILAPDFWGRSHTQKNGRIKINNSCEMEQRILFVLFIKQSLRSSDFHWCVITIDHHHDSMKIHLSLSLFRSNRIMIINASTAKAKQTWETKYNLKKSVTVGTLCFIFSSFHCGFWIKVNIINTNIYFYPESNIILL